MSSVLTASLSEASGVDLESFRSDHVCEGVRRAVQREGVESARALPGLLRRSPEARERFRRIVAVTVSGLYRDPAQFELLKRELLPPLLAADRKLRVWSAGCADGSELYTVALLLQEAGALERSFLLGSDVLEENLSTARHGVYQERTIPAEIRMLARWEQRDLVRDGAPAGKWNVILCRNVAIYLTPEAKTSLHTTLAGALSQAGVLLLGRSERIADPAAFSLESIGPHAYRRTR